MLTKYPTLRDLAVKTGEYSYIDLANDVEAAWQREDLLTGQERLLLHQLFIDGTPFRTALYESSLSEPQFIATVVSSLNKLRDDLNGYATDEQSTTVTHVEQLEESLLTDYDDSDSGIEYPFLTERQYRRRVEREVSYEKQFKDGR